MKKFWRYLKKILFWIFFVCLFLVTTVVVLLHIYEDDIKQYAIDEINSHLNTDLDVQSIELSFFHDFPRASLEFRHVLIHDAYKETISEDTLFYSRQAFLSFNIWDLWNGDYRVNRISFKKSKLNLKTTASGDVNYDILKDDDDTTESNFRFVMDLLRIDELEFTYLNLATGQNYCIDFNKALLSGDFSQNEFEIHAETEMFVKKLKSNSLTLIRNKPATGNIILHVNTQSEKYTFNQGDITIAKMPFELTGYIDSTSVDLEISGNNIELADLANSLSAGTMPSATKYKSTGELSFSSRIMGPMSKTAMPSITADFKLDEGTLTNPVNNLKIYDIELDGRYENAQSEREEQLLFKKFNLKLLNSFFEGSGDVRNFSEPDIHTKMKGNLDLFSFNQFFQFPGIEKIEGNVVLDCDLAIRFLDPQYRADKFVVSKSNGSLGLKNVSYKHVKDPITYHDMNGNVVIVDNDAAVKDLSFKTDKSDFLVNGALNNLLQYLAGYGGLGMIATIESEHVDLNEFIGESKQSENESPEKFILPADLNLNVDLNIGKLDWDEHVFENVNTNLIYMNRKATAGNFSLNTMGGSVAGTLMLNNMLEAGNVIEANLTYKNIDVKRMFAEWKNFDQETITDKHLSGKSNGNLDILMFFNPYFSLIEDKLFAVSNIEITNGELNNMETMKLITDYMRSNKALKLMLNKHIDKFEDKLLHLKFATLSNTIEIKDRKIYIPKMIIASNALTVELFGWHDFDNNVEYHFSFRFRELKTVAEYTEFGKIEDDGLGLVIYMTMSGPMDNPEFAMDNNELKNDLKEDLASEKQTLKSILKTEFGMYKNDSTVIEMGDRNKAQVEFIFYEEDGSDTLTTDKIKKKKNRSGNIFGDLEEKSKNEKEEVEFGEDE